MTTIAGPGKEVSEKSLELNVCAELLQHIRSWPGCEKALWLGLTQAQERRKGIDELIRNVGPGFALMLQFKAPWPTSVVDDLYKFSINERQHEALEQLSGQHPEAVHYVFPLYSKWQKADRYAPDLAQDTWLVPVSSMPLTSLTAFSPSPMVCLQDAYAAYIKLAKLWGNYSHTDGQRLTNGQWFKECRRFTQRDIQPYGKCGFNWLT